MSHIEIISEKTFNIIKNQNTNRKFANIYWSNICLSNYYETISNLLNKLSEVFKNKELILNVLFVKNKTHSNYSLDNNNVFVENINSNIVANMIKDSKYL